MFLQYLLLNCVSEDGGGMGTSEDLLIWGRRQADPWNRLGNQMQPLLVVIEFCQVEGPRPLVVRGLDDKNKVSLDLDAISLWLMSSEASSGSISVLYNQESALYAVSYYCTVYDVQARAFQRPVCIAYLHGDKPSRSLVSRFISRVRRLVSPLLNCNRRLFLRLLAKLVALSDDLNSDLVHEYYALYRLDQLEEPAKKKIQTLADQARKLRSRLEMMSESISRQLEGDCLKHEDANLPQWIFEGGDNQSMGLRPLAPCEYDNFHAGLADLLEAIRTKECEQGVLYSANTAVLRFPKCNTPVKEKLRRDEWNKGEETLKTCTSHLDQILYPVVVGDDLAVAGSHQRRNSVTDLVSKLEFIRPKAHLNNKVTVWNKRNEGCNGVFGVECSPRKLPPNCERILDLNSCLLHGVSYTGSLLSPFQSRRSFPSDSSLLSFISSTFSLSCQLVFLCRYIPLSVIVDTEKLSNEDQRILASLLSEVEFSKFSSLKERMDKLPPTVPPRPIQLK
ncbi:hypothetical protein PFISCL1PPCAC_10405 [Pristionchus fissidentatus]|uniref:UDENN FLCN/SMCR8-type domain-containing protein n=1 Tax=Pristionchus fissidentatus TaxID=1538716 RepID=A0AAV5VLF5_9BILA|nr:hypothetical protein PFISCL1PPCAC_10405 [Pristionchus fissidentatus]